MDKETSWIVGVGHMRTLNSLHNTSTLERGSFAVRFRKASPQPRALCYGLRFTVQGLGFEEVANLLEKVFSLTPQTLNLNTPNPKPVSVPMLHGL